MNGRSSTRRGITILFLRHSSWGDGNVMSHVKFAPRSSVWAGRRSLRPDRYVWRPRSSIDRVQPAHHAISIPYHWSDGETRATKTWFRPLRAERRRKPVCRQDALRPRRYRGLPPPWPGAKSVRCGLPRRFFLDISGAISAHCASHRSLA